MKNFRYDVYRNRCSMEYDNLKDFDSLPHSASGFGRVNTYLSFRENNLFSLQICPYAKYNDHDYASCLITVVAALEPMS